MKKFLLEKYAILRARLNPIKLETSHKYWNDYMTMPMWAFSDAINSFQYKPDKLKGLIDRTDSFSHFINPDVRSDRDCDDFARMWTMWGIENGYKAIEVIVTTRKKFFQNSHVVTFLQDKDGYQLMNYRPYPEKDREGERLLKKALSKWYGCKEEDLLYAVSLVGWAKGDKHEC